MNPIHVSAHFNEQTATERMTALCWAIDKAKATFDGYSSDIPGDLQISKMWEDGDDSKISSLEYNYTFEVTMPAEEGTTYD